MPDQNAANRTSERETMPLCAASSSTRWVFAALCLLLLGLAGCFAYASLPAGGRMISRMVDAPA